MKFSVLLCGIPIAITKPWNEIKNMWTNQVIEAANEVAVDFQSGQITLLTESDLKTSLANKIKEKLSSNITV